MNDRIHDDEPDTGEAVVRTLLETECPAWAPHPLEYLRTSGTDNAMWRVRVPDRRDVVVRLPRRPAAAAGADHEIAVLQQLDQVDLAMITTPTVRHVGEPHDLFPYRWSVLEWVDGIDAWTGREHMDPATLRNLADDLGQVINQLGRLANMEAPIREPGSRGGPLGPLLDRLDGWLNGPEWNAAGLIDVAAVQRLAAEGREVAGEPIENRFVHGDLIPGNLLLDQKRLVAILDWGGAGRGDPAQDLAPAWSVLTARERPAFRDAMGTEDDAWIRGRTFELEHAVGGVLYYVPRGHPLGDVMARTLDRILTES